MRRRTSQQRLTKRRQYIHEQRPEPVLRNGFAVVRPIEEDEAADIRLGLAKISAEVPGMLIKGYGFEYPAGLTVVGKHETADFDFLYHAEEQMVTNSLFANVPTLQKARTSSIHSIGRFGNERSKKISIGAAIDDIDPFHTSERGNVHATLSELNDWNPVHLAPSRPHITFVAVPRDSDPQLVHDLRREVASIVPAELHFMPARIIL